MSNELLSLAWKVRLKKGPKMVLVALADAADKAGVCWPSRSALAEKAECAESTVSRHLQLLIRVQVISQKRGRRRAATYQIDKAVLATLQDVSDQDILKEDISNQDVSLTLVKTSQTETSLKGTLIEPLTSAIADEHPEARKLCERLADLMVANDCTRPMIGKTWLDAARLLLDKDRRTFDYALAVLEWCQADTFWKGNIRSLPTFRAKYDQLRLQAEGRGELTPARRRLDSEDAANTWLKDEWRAGRVRNIEQRTGLRYPQPDLPVDIPQERSEQWLVTRCREWIAANHDVIIDRLVGREESA